LLSAAVLDLIETPGRIRVRGDFSRLGLGEQFRAGRNNSAASYIERRQIARHRRRQPDDLALRDAAEGSQLLACTPGRGRDQQQGNETPGNGW
jgi:hypothetical protein